MFWSHCLEVAVKRGRKEAAVARFLFLPRPTAAAATTTTREEEVAAANAAQTTGDAYFHLRDSAIPAGKLRPYPSIS